MPRVKRNSQTQNFIYFKKGYEFYQRGQFEKAEKQLRILMQLSPKFIQGYNVLVKLYVKNHKFEKAKQILLKAIQAHPNNSKFYFKLARFLAKQQKFNQSIKYLLTALKIEPKNSRYHNLLGLILQRIGKIQQATKQYQRVVQIQPKHHTAHSILGGIYLIQGQYEKAKNELQIAVILNPNHVFSQYTLGTLYYEEGEYTKALQKFTKTVNLKPKVLTYRRDLGMAYKMLGKFDQAIKEFQKILSIDKQNCEAQNQIGNILCAQKKYIQAVQHFQKSIQNDEEYYEAHKNLAYSYKFLQKYEQQKKQLLIALSLKQNSITILLNYSIMSIQNEQIQKADSCLKKIMEIINQNNSQVKMHQLLAQQNLLKNDVQHIKEGTYLFSKAQTSLKLIQKNYKHFYCPSKSLLQLLTIIYQPVVKYLQLTVDQIIQPSKSQQQFNTFLQSSKVQIQVKMRQLEQYLQFKQKSEDCSQIKKQIVKDVHFIHISRESNANVYKNHFWQICTKKTQNCQII